MCRSTVTSPLWEIHDLCKKPWTGGRTPAETTCPKVKRLGAEQALPAKSQGRNCTVLKGDQSSAQRPESPFRTGACRQGPLSQGRHTHINWCRITDLAAFSRMCALYCSLNLSHNQRSTDERATRFIPSVLIRTWPSTASSWKDFILPWVPSGISGTSVKQFVPHRVSLRGGEVDPPSGHAESLPRKTDFLWATKSARVLEIHGWWANAVPWSCKQT